jgi:hypothetical protein
MQLRIEKRIPLTKPIRSFAQRKYPFHEMQIGDSFSIAPVAVKNARSAAYIYGTRKNMKFACRKVGNKYRIWRTG